MSELQLTIEEKQTFLDVLGRVIPRIAVALLFLALGWSKFGANSVWVRMFDQIGFGQWFRVLTGALQVGGAVLTLIPRVSWIGAAILSCTMLGAVLTQLFILHTGLLAISPAVLMVITGVVCAQARGWI
jgi:putative oxidoreductase